MVVCASTEFLRTVTHGAKRFSLCLRTQKQTWSGLLLIILQQ
ncbi:hypothetical protein RDI58_024148 [Solanum bulbocastanum]|uniref:Uncharacterized protein n=1 Tax=Solanum bulbocastanum TaxID=147425 RepID=A0AAN8Y3B3_SOLBU